MRNNSRNRHVERRNDIDQRFAIPQKRIDKFAHQLAVRASVTAGSNPGRQRRTIKVGEILLKSFVLAVISPAFPANSPDFAATASRVPTDRHSRRTSVTRLKECNL